MDISGESQTDISHNIVKTRLDERGVPVPNSVITDLQNDLDKLNEQRQNGYCGSCYGGVEPASGCCNTCEEVRQAYVNRGWSFNRPDSIEQVSIAAYFQVVSPHTDRRYLRFVVCQGGLVRKAEGAGTRRLQHLRTRPREQGRREHPPVARPLVPHERTQPLRARPVPPHGRQPPRLHAHDPSPRVRGGRRVRH